MSDFYKIKEDTDIFIIDPKTEYEGLSNASESTDTDGIEDNQCERNTYINPNSLYRKE